MKLQFKWTILGSVLCCALALTACNSGSSVLGNQPPMPSVRTHARTAASACLSMACIYVYSSKNKQSTDSQITSYPSGGSGNIAPVGRIVGNKTGLYDAAHYFGIAAGPDRKTYVFNCGLDFCYPTIDVFAAGATGNVAPIASITGSNTGLLNGNGHVAVDNDSNIYVDSAMGNRNGTVTVYAAGSNGNVSPMQTITGSNTLLMDPNGIAVDSAHNVYVVDSSPYSIYVYAAGSNGNVAPIRDISGSNTGFNGPFGIAVDSSNNIYVTNNGSNEVSVFSAGANGNVAPVRSLQGGATKLSHPFSIALDSNNNIYVSNVNATLTASYVTVYKAGAKKNANPIQVIRGSATFLDGHFATGIAVQ